jgi:hypothetical protein
MIFGRSTTQAKAIGLLLAFIAAICGTAWSQGVIHVVPAQPYHYSDLPTSQNIDINGDGIPDFNLSSPNGIQIDLNPLNNNSILAVPEQSPDVGVLIAALTQGAAISSSASSLDPTFVWYGNNSPYGGSATIVAASDIGSIGYFQGNSSAYAGFELNIGDYDYFGWFYIHNLGANIGQITDWAYESSPNTPIEAGAVHEPSTLGLLMLGAILFFVKRKRPSFPKAARVCWNPGN